MKKVIVIGGGASGLVAAIHAAKQNNQVTIIDKNNIYGKKILITGNGKCNYWNEDISVNHYNSFNKETLNKIITEENKQAIISFFNNLGIIPKIKDGYYYPASNQATSIQTALVKEANLQNIQMITNEEVISIVKTPHNFIVKSTNKEILADKVILATGSFACPKTGSDGLGYKLASHFEHNIIEPLPALVQLKGNEAYFKDWQGVRTDVKVTLSENNQVIKKTTGEIQLTNYGVSGICIFQLSGLISRGLFEKKQEQLYINFLYPIKIHTADDFITWMNNRNQNIPNRTISELLDGCLNYKLVNLLLKQSNIKKEDDWNQISHQNKILLSKNLTNFKLDITGTNSFDQAQVATGGIPLSEINPNTMESLKQKGLYIVGELLDADGECGGYNLGFAWITGYLAGSSIKGE